MEIATLTARYDKLPLELRNLIDNFGFGSLKLADNGTDFIFLAANGTEVVRMTPNVFTEVAKLRTKLLNGNALDIKKLFDNGFGTILNALDETEQLARLARLNQWEPKLIDDLATRLGKTNYPDLATDLKNPDFFNLYDDIIHNPKANNDILDEAFEFNENLKHVQRSAFWQAIRAEADAFENAMSVKALQKLNPPCKWLDEAGEVAADYTPHKQLYLKRVAQKSNGQLSTVSDGKVFIGDDVHIKTKKNEFGVAQYNQAKYHDSKLSDTAPWTPNQRSELIDLFKNDSRLEYVEFEIRTSDDFLQQSPYKNGMKVRIYRDDIYKSFKQGETQVTKKVVL